MLLSLPLNQRIQVVSQLEPHEAALLAYDWDVWARDKQREPDNWSIWLLQTGRGWGKNLTGAQTTRKYKETNRASHIALVGPTAADARDVMLGLGGSDTGSGLLQVCPPWNRPTYEPSKRRAIWPDGAQCTLYSAEEPDRLRGPEHDFGWCDEPAAWSHGEDTLSNFFLGLRQGEAKAIFTTTPRSTAFMRKIRSLSGIQITTGSMSENNFLSDAARERLIAEYGGTRLGLQELEGLMLEDNPNALWTYEMIDADRMKPDVYQQKVASGEIVVDKLGVSIDPAVTSNEKSDESGIVVGHSDRNNPKNAYILDDLSLIGRPEKVASVAVTAYRKYGGDRILGEVNNGGDWIESLIRQVDNSVSYLSVRATRGKALRAEPVSALYEKHRVIHVGSFPRLEQQMLEFDGDLKGKSPDRLDALVWLLTWLLLNRTGGGRFFSW